MIIWRTRPNTLDVKFQVTVVPCTCTNLRKILQKPFKWQIANAVQHCNCLLSVRSLLDWLCVRVCAFASVCPCVEKPKAESASDLALSILLAGLGLSVSPLLSVPLFGQSWPSLSAGLGFCFGRSPISSRPVSAVPPCVPTWC